MVTKCISVEGDWVTDVSLHSVEYPAPSCYMLRLILWNLLLVWCVSVQQLHTAEVCTLPTISHTPLRISIRHRTSFRRNTYSSAECWPVTSMLANQNLWNHRSETGRRCLCMTQSLTTQKIHRSLWCSTTLRSTRNIWLPFCINGLRRVSSFIDVL